MGGTSPPGKYSQDYWGYRSIRSLLADYQEYSLIIEQIMKESSNSDYQSKIADDLLQIEFLAQGP